MSTFMITAKFNKIKQYLLKNADPIEKQATLLHKKYLKGNRLREKVIESYRDIHINIVHEIANRIDTDDIEKEAKFFRELGTKISIDAVKVGLTIEETINGSMFLKQAIWTNLKKEGLLKDLGLDNFFEINNIVSTYTDTLASTIAFTFHNELQYIEKNLLFLAEASKLLSSSLDYQTTLDAVAKLAVPQVSDWCTIELLDDVGELNQVVVAHKDPEKVKWALELRKHRPVDMNAPTGTPNVLRTGKSELYPLITDEMLVAMSKTKKELQLLRSIGFTSAMVVPIFSKEKAIGTISFITTTTNRQYNQASLAIAEELGTRASIAIENARLYKGSQEAISMRDDFISVASHELKTPVTSVKMFTQVLKKHSEQIGDTKAVSHLSKMDKQIDKLTELIYDLLNVSKIQAGRMEFRNELFDFDKAIKDIVVILQTTTESHKLVLTGKTCRNVYGDQERIGQVVNNLVSNAIKYSPKADKVLVNLSADDNNVRVDVTDLGIGMAKQHLEKIFERFYRVYDTTDKTFPGLGIGLYISSEIIKRHGGKLLVESDPGKGSTISFFIPINKKKYKK